MEQPFAARRNISGDPAPRQVGRSVISRAPLLRTPAQPMLWTLIPPMVGIANELERILAARSQYRAENAFPFKMVEKNSDSR
ncbi:hypothetical protein ACERNI_12430 [Camelimonas sp. ID_303_24]